MLGIRPCLSPRQHFWLTFPMTVAIAAILSTLGPMTEIRNPELQLRYTTMLTLIPFVGYAWVGFIGSPRGFAQMPRMVQWAIVLAMIAVVVFF